MEKSTFIIDIDDTISETLTDENGKGLYHEARPIKNTIVKLRKLHSLGHTIKLFTARGMRTYNGNVEKIKEAHLDILTDWLQKNDVPYDELIFGKPWGPNVYYVDDKSLTVNQFLLHSEDQYADVVAHNSWWRKVND
jgi:capsule biosynthesis phosphatase